MNVDKPPMRQGARGAPLPEHRAPSERERGREPYPAHGRARVVIESVTPSVDNGRFAAKRIVGDAVAIEADCFADGHATLMCLVRWRHEDVADWHEIPMTALGNDRWRASVVVDAPGRYTFAIVAWIDAFLSWRHDFLRRIDTGDVLLAAHTGAELIAAAAARADGVDRQALHRVSEAMLETGDIDDLRALVEGDALVEVANRYPDRNLPTTSTVEYPLVVDRARARYSAWYELFPRSASAVPGQHGTLRDCIARLPYVARMGFDVLYLPPIHPIGRDRRKGRNNAPHAATDDVGSPWAIGSREGGHKALLGALGSFDDFHALVAACDAHGLELALDIAFQCAPDHPYVNGHPSWFRHRADGSVQYAENPPKKYQDIYPFDFDSPDWQALWSELESVLEFWTGHGVKIFRVDNPHTKPFAFWEWAIARVKHEHPDVLFLAEAFTRPKVMHRLAKLGFSQSYTYFTWRNTKRELIEYFTELSAGPGRDYFRPNCWPNTPDILPEPLQSGGRPTFAARLVLAATLSSNYGIYGPAFELLQHAAHDSGSEEYLDSEKYQLRQWDLERADSLAPLVERVNAARRDNPALHANDSLKFVDVDNDELIAYTKVDEGSGNVVLVVVNLDPHNVQSGWIHLDLAAMGIDADRGFQAHDLLSDARYAWSGSTNFVMLDPARVPAHVFRLRYRARTEYDFDYFL
ncbi:MAG: alpha-1,4-glucan--maltose-1-phosphate maltosyltransferase [Betaproteobacteria bacterium]